MKALIWLTVVVVSLLVLRFAPKTTANPLDAQAIDKAFHIGVNPLPEGWRAEWVTDEKSARRLALSPADGSADIQVVAFKGDLDKEKLAEIGALLYGPTFPSAKSTVDVQGYGSTIRRSTYTETSNKKRPIYTTIDLLWHVGATDYAYAIVARSFRPSDESVDLAKAQLIFSPPRLNLLGRAGSSLAVGFEFLETGESWFAILTWLAATGWGLWYLVRKLDEHWRPAKYLVGIAIVGLMLAARAVFGLSWLLVGFSATLLVAASGAAAALLSGAWRIEE